MGDARHRPGQRGALGDRPEDPRLGHRPGLRGHRRPRHRRPAPPASRYWRGCARAATTAWPTCSPEWTSPRPGHRLRCRRRGAAAGARRFPAGQRPDGGLGPAEQPRDQPHRLPDAPRRADQTVAAPALLLRPAPARRGAQPRHQRHRQHRPDAPADDGPGGQLAADRHRCAGDDVLDIAAARPGGAGDGAALLRGRHPGRQALPAALRQPVVLHGHAQRPHRGDVHRPQPGQGLRPPGRVGRAVRRGERRALPGVLQGPVHQRHHAAADDVRLQLQLRAGRRRRRPPGRLGRPVHRRRAGVHPVLPAVLDAADPGRLDGQPGAVRRRLRRAGLRTPRRRRAGARPGPRRPPGEAAGPRRPGEGLLPLRAGAAPDRGPLPDRRAGPHGRHRRPDRQPARPPWSTC